MAGLFLCHYALKPSFALRPVRHDTNKKLEKRCAMIRVRNMTQFMCDYIVNGVRRCFN